MPCYAVLCCAVLAVLLQILNDNNLLTYNENTMKKRKKERQESKKSKEFQEGSPTDNIIVGNFRLRRAERWENIPRVSSEVAEI